MGSVFSFLFLDNFDAVVTLLVGLLAYFVYVWQKRDTKINAARVILSEIRNAEKEIEIIKGFIKNASSRPE